MKNYLKYKTKYLKLKTNIDNCKNNYQKQQIQRDYEKRHNSGVELEPEGVPDNDPYYNEPIIFDIDNF